MLVLYVILLLLYINICDGIVLQLDLLALPPYLRLISSVENLTTYHHIVSPSTVYIESVNEGIINLWHASNESEYCISVTGYLQNDRYTYIYIKTHNIDTLCYRFFERRNDGWISLIEEEFSKKLYKFIYEVTIDLSLDEYNCLKTININEFGNINIKYKTFRTLDIVKVIDNNELLWESNEHNEICLEIIYNNRINWYKILILKITIKRSNNYNYNYYIKYNNDNNNLWIKTDESINTQLLISNNETRLDINNNNNINNELYNIIYPNNDGIPSIIYTTKTNVYLTEINSNLNIIWKSNNYNDTCTLVIIHSSNSLPVLLQLYIKTSEPSDGNLYFMKLDNDNWIQVTKEEFYIKLEEYDQNEDEHTS